MERIITYLQTYFDWFYIPRIHITDVIEMLIIAFVIYQVIKWFQTTRAWTLFKGIIVLLIFMALASIFKFNTILWILNKTINIAIIALLIIFQPELRRALEKLGRNNYFSKLFGIVEQKDRQVILSNAMIQEIVKATFAMASVKTGALIVIQKTVALGEYESTGIPVDAAVSSQLIENIFEKNTPLHDGAMIIKDGRIATATCYLPLSNNMEISKSMGTRHRAALGISEVSDSVTIIVSEETGMVSIAYDGNITRNMSEQSLTTALKKLNNQKKSLKRVRMRKERKKDEGKTAE